MPTCKLAQRTKVFRLQPRSHEERSNHAWLLSQAADGQVKFQMEFFHVEADQVAHLDMLEVLPGAFDGIQVRGIRRQPLDAKATSRVAGKELLDCGAAMDGRPVPDYQESRSDMPDQVLEELDGVQPVEHLLTHQGVDLALRRDTPHDREVVARLPLVEDRRVPLGRVGPDLARQEVEARFIHENQGAALAAGLCLEPRPDLDSPLLDLLLVALDGPRDRQLWRPVQFLQEPGDVARMVGNAELLLDDLGDAGAGPDLTAKAVGFRPMRQEVRNERN